MQNIDKQTVCKIFAKITKTQTRKTYKIKKNTKTHKPETMNKCKYTRNTKLYNKKQQDHKSSEHTKCRKQQNTNTENMQTTENTKTLKSTKPATTKTQ